MEDLCISSASSQGQQQKKLIVKVVYQDLKFKQAIPEGQITFSQLKNSLLQKINASETIPLNNDQLVCLDDSDFEYNDEDQVSDFLNNNDILKLKKKEQNQNQNQNQQQSNEVKQQPQQEKQDQQEQKQQQESQNCDIPDDVQAKLQDKQEFLDGNVKDDPVEAIVVVYDVSGSMGCRFFGDKDLSRMGATNAFFSAFADKTMAFEFNHLLSLYCFDSQIERKCDFIKDYQKFINLVDSANPGSSTRLYDTIQIAIESLLEIKQKYPNIILRILALTDGEDNQSKAQPIDLIKQIISNSIIMDSFVVGDNCIGLKSITHASGGKCYKPQDINQGLQLFEIETIISAKSRGLEDSHSQIDPNSIDMESLKQKPFDQEGIQVQKPKEMQKQAQSAEQIIKKIQAREQEEQKQQGSSKKTHGKACLKRIHKELLDIVNNPDAEMKYFPTSDNLQIWKILMKGHKNSPYVGGVYQLYVEFPDDYPFKPPKVRFITQIYHCNISSNGALCLDILKDNWSPALTINRVMLSIHNLLNDPNPDDALNSSIASEMRDTTTFHIYKQKATEFTQKHANQAVGDLLADILGSEVDINSQAYLEKKKEIGDWIQSK